MHTNPAILIAAAIAVVTLAALAYWLLRRKKQSAVAHDPLLDRARAQAERAMDNLNRTAQAFQFEAGTAALLDRVTKVLEQLGGVDCAPIERNIGQRLRKLSDLLRAYRALANGRTSETGGLSLYPHDASQQDYTFKMYMELTDHVLGIATAIDGVQGTRDMLTALCNEIELAIAQNSVRNEQLRSQANQIALSLKELANTGFTITLLRQRLAAARGQLTQATAAGAESNYRTARQHLDAATTTIASLQTVAEDMPKRLNALKDRLSDYDVQVNGAPAAFKPATEHLARLRRRYNIVALAAASKEMVTARHQLRGLDFQLAKLREHLEKYEIDEAELVAEALDVALRSIREMPALMRAHAGTLEKANNEFIVQATATTARLAGLTRRIGERKGNQQRRRRALEALKDRVAAARALVRTNPVAALAEIEKIAKAAAEQEARSVAAHNTAVDDATTEK